MLCAIPMRRGALMVTVYGFSRVNSFARGRTRDLRVLWALEEMGVLIASKGWIIRRTTSTPMPIVA